MDKIKRLCILLVYCSLMTAAAAQTVRDIEVSADEAFTDHVALLEDSRDMDLMVKVVFNEEANQLTVSLISYRDLFVFREDTRYKGAVRCRKLRPNNFPYMVEAEPGAKFKLTKSFRRTLSKPRRKHVFKRWIEYEGLQPAPMEYKMVNDYIEQTFDIVGKLDYVSVTLRDLIVMEATRKSQKKPPVYSLFFRKDLNTKYQIHILRNPCFGQEEEIAAAKNACEGIAKAYRIFAKMYASGKVDNHEKLKSFEELKEALLKQYQKIDDISACMTIQQARDQYNLYVDSIAGVKCVVPEVEKESGIGLTEKNYLDHKTILSNARQIDNAVARWLVSQDDIERHDLIKRCQALIEATSSMIGGRHGATKEQQNAIALFRSAERYFNKTCKK